MKYDVLTIQNLRKEKNPTDELLTMWSHHNHTISELFVLLSRMQHYQAMIPLKNFVEPKFHVLIDTGEGNLQKVLGKLQLNKSSKDLKIGAHNFNRNVPIQPVLPKVIVQDNSEEESRKILNAYQGARPAMPPSNSNNLLVASKVATPPLTPPVQQSRSNPNNESLLAKTDFTLPQISYEELAIATNAWSKHNVLGRGGFGMVFKGKPPFIMYFTKNKVLLYDCD